MGVFHGVNPAMGWPLAVAAGLSERRGSAVLATWLPLGVGHLLAMALVLVPFSVLAWALEWQHEIRVCAGVLVVLFGVWRFFQRRHPRWLARIRPTQIALWSFAMATAHGAALMLLPMWMGLCAAPPGAGAEPGLVDHAAIERLMRSGSGTAVSVSLVHTASMMGAGLAMAWVFYRHLGLGALRHAWFDLDRVWSIGLIASGLAAIALAG